VLKVPIARLAYRIALHTENVYDDLFVDRLQPFRFVWIIPLVILNYLFVYLALDHYFFNDILLVLMIWLGVDFVNSILNGVNDVYKHNPRYTGASVGGYIGLLKVVAVVAGMVFTISFFFEVEPIALLSGIGAWLAVLLLIFRDTILSFLASIQISTQQLIKEGDSVDIPAFDASGTVSNIDLQTVTIQNYDNTITTIPTEKIVETGFKNYRTMIESGARRIKRSILIDITSIQFLDENIADQIRQADVLNEFTAGMDIETNAQETNLELFIRYTRAYLQQKKQVRQRRYPFIVRVLAPTSEGLPLEIYLFVKVDNWEKLEEFQAEIFIHLIAVLPLFGLRIYQV
jgi:miniconductance mechanosensitive channel